MTISVDSSDDKLEEMVVALRAYHKLHDGLSDMIESGRLTEDKIPDDYQWLVKSLENLGNMPIND